MILYTGDTHGKIEKITNAVRNGFVTTADTIVILGDAGFNYYGNEAGDKRTKSRLNKEGVTVFCIHGNHEMRPETIPTYITKIWNGGTAYYEEKYPNILFAKDGEIYDLDGRKTIVIGGAYSVDKFYRLRNGYRWFPDEQPSEETKERVEAVLEGCNWEIDQVLTHTCPSKYIPMEAFLSCVDQSTVDNSTEEWLDTIEKRLKYGRWLCGHWHIDKKIDDFRFVMEDVIL
ncbi:MAG: metallophosphoesterase [Ruminiclostridium sp.]